MSIHRMLPDTILKSHRVAHAVFLLLCIWIASADIGTDSMSEGGAANDYTMFAEDAEGLDSGEMVCEGHDYDEASCLEIGCCAFEDGQCWSKVGDRPCNSANDDSDPMGELEPDAIDSKTMTVSEAQVFCNKLPQCLGFTFQGRPVEQDASRHIFFKSTSTVGRKGWTSYLHNGVQSSPAEKPTYRFRGKLISLDSESEPGPDSLYTGAILNMVATTFKRITQNTEMDVLVNCYAPWCGFCQKFKSQYGKLARDLRHVETLQITQIDATKNHMQDLEISSFPTVILFPAGARKDQPIKYIGNRSPVDMLHWLHRHATHANFSDVPPESENTEELSGLLGSEEDL